VESAAEMTLFNYLLALLVNDYVINSYYEASNHPLLEIKVKLSLWATGRLMGERI